jgi:integrase
MIHVRQSKGKKDRYVPMGKVLTDGIKKYIDAERPTNWLFNGKGDPLIEGRKGGDFDSRYSQRGVQWAIKEAVKQAGIKGCFSSYPLTYLRYTSAGGWYRYYDHSKAAGT